MAGRFLPVPTYADPVLSGIDKKTGKERSAFNPVWLSWFLQLTNGSLGGITDHNSLSGLQGGSPGQYLHLSTAQFNSIPFRDLSLPFNIAVGATPFTYHNTNGYDMDVLATGGTTVSIEYSRDGATWYAVGAATSMVRLSTLDFVRITHVTPPTLTGIPR